MSRRSLAVAAALLYTTLLSLTAPTFGQSAEGRISLGANAGLAKYWGSFTDDQFWLGGDLTLRWNLLPSLSVNAQFGIAQLRYRVAGEVRAGHPDYFGAPDATVYAADPTIPIEEKNAIRVNTYGGFLSYNLLPQEKLVPYLFAGVGVMNFEPRTLGNDLPLPNNRAGIYDKNVLFYPAGIGLEFYATDDLTLNARAQLNLTPTDYLDDYSDAGSSSNDAFATFTVGVGYYIFGSLDCDRDGLTDEEERRVGSDICRADTDGDGLNDFEEVRTHNTDPTRPDSDDDGLNDFEEVRTYATNPRNPDSDSDGLKDGEEVSARKTDPKKADTDGDGLTDGDEVLRHRTNPTATDTDGDELGDGEEVTVYGTSPTAVDTDDDRLADGAEIRQHKTNPKVADSDGDGLSDGDEVNVQKTNPLVADTDQDRLNDGDEVLRVHTDPLKPDTDGDGVIDGDDRCPLFVGVRERFGCPAPPKVGTITDFPEIYFKVNTDEFDFSRPETDENLAKLLAYINQCPGLAVIIEGHASREGNETRNQELSDMRAARVRNWLVERGADPAKIEATIGFGSRRTAVDEPDPKSAEARRMDPAQLEALRRQNRRIAVKVARSCDDERYEVR